jgi:hypothetical protein
MIKNTIPAMAAIFFSHPNLDYQYAEKATVCKADQKCLRLWRTDGRFSAAC